MKTERYRTKTLHIAAYLYASGLQLINTTKNNGEVFFEFIPKEEAEERVKDYFAGTATCSPRELFARLNDLRDLIFSGGRE